MAVTHHFVYAGAVHCDEEPGAEPYGRRGPGHDKRGNFNKFKAYANIM